MKIIETKFVEINKEKRIALFFKYNLEVINLVKQIEGADHSVPFLFYYNPNPAIA